MDDKQECTMHSCRSKFCNRILIAINCLVLGDMHRQCLPEWHMQTNKSAQCTLVGQSSAFKLWMRNSMPFWETCTGNVSQNETLRPSGVHIIIKNSKKKHFSFFFGEKCTYFFRNFRNMIFSGDFFKILIW